MLCAEWRPAKGEARGRVAVGSDRNGVIVCVMWYSREHRGTASNPHLLQALVTSRGEVTGSCKLYVQVAGYFFIRLVFSESNMGREMRAGLYATSVRFAE
jgi:hypothetical protein